MKKMWNVAVAMSRPVLLGAIALVALILLLGFRLVSLTPGLSAVEVATYQSADSVSDIIENSVNAPYRIAVYVATRLFDNSFGLRIVSASIGILMIGLFYLFATRLLRPAIATAVTILFATSFLFLHTARLATPDVMLFSLVALMACGYIIRFHKQSGPAWIAASAVIALSIYVPGMLPFIIIGAIWQFRHVRRSFEELPTLTIVICSAVFSILVAPIVINLIRTPDLWQEYLGISEPMAPVRAMAKEALVGLSSLFAYAPNDPARWLGRQPALDVFSTVMFVYGGVALAHKLKLHRLWALLGIFVITVLWAGLSRNYINILILLPFIYILVGVGIERLIDQWQSVFPRNPIARSIGSILMIAVIVLSANFQIQRYFVAWPNNAETKQIYKEQFPDTTP